MRPFFSIIVATLNDSSKLTSCINSLNTQSYNSYEVLISDGGSTDATPSLLNDRFIRNLSWSKSSMDKGIYDALNIALSAASGDWILVLGSDDSLFHEDSLARAYEFISTQRVQPYFYYSDIYIKKFSGTVLKTYPNINKFNELYGGAPFFHHQSVFVNRLEIEKLGGFDMRYRLHSDYDLILKIHRLVPARKIDYAFVVYDSTGLTSKLSNMMASLFEVYLIRKRNGFNPFSLRIGLIYVKALLFFFANRVFNKN